MLRLPGQILRAWSSLRPYRPMDGHKAALEAEYQRGAWDYLAGLPELARFSVLAGYCHALADRPDILEIGCGEGLLAERLCPSRVAAYTGVDISETAIERARAKGIANTNFAVSDALTFSPTGSYDPILFTECLEYFEDPAALVQRFERSLARGGSFIVSMFVGVDTNRSHRIWKMLAGRYETFDETRVSNAQGLSWVIKVLRR